MAVVRGILACQGMWPRLTMVRMSNPASRVDLVPKRKVISFDASVPNLPDGLESRLSLQARALQDAK